MLDLQVIDEPAAATAVLDPVRSRLLAALRAPGSASSLAAAMGMPRQKVNYHLRTLEHLGLVRHIESRPRRGLTERVVQSTASSYVLSPSVLGANAPEPTRLDRLSTAYLVAVAARLVREVGELARRADEVGRPLPTLTIDTEVTLGSAADRAAFTAELADAVTDLVGRYHAPDAVGGRPHRLVVAAHPLAAAAVGQPASAPPGASLAGLPMSHADAAGQATGTAYETAAIPTPPTLAEEDPT